VQGIAHIGLGSNLGDRLAHLEGALTALDSRDDVDVVAVSPVYETAPMYVTEQPAFLNAAASLSTTLTPFGLLDLLLATEKALGRERTVRFGPRTLDLDILLWIPVESGASGGIVRCAELTVPHSRLVERAFALVPLSDVAGEVPHPVLESTIGELAARVDQRDIARSELAIRAVGQTKFQPGSS